jgi:hypothetical protein
MSNDNFQLLSITPMTERPHPRVLAKAAVARYRSGYQKPEPPPLGSLRAVFYAASTGRRRSLRERVRDRLQRWLQ